MPTRVTFVLEYPTTQSAVSSLSGVYVEAVVRLDMALDCNPTKDSRSKR